MATDNEEEFENNDIHIFFLFFIFFLLFPYPYPMIWIPSVKYKWNCHIYLKYFFYIFTHLLFRYGGSFSRKPRSSREWIWSLGQISVKKDLKWNKKSSARLIWWSSTLFTTFRPHFQYREKCKTFAKMNRSSYRTFFG